jgi:YbbR domain-containing protein
MKNNIFAKIGRFFDRKIINPTTKLILNITEKFDKSGKRFENWLSKTTTLLFISLVLAILAFIVVDQKMIFFSENSAEVLKSQKVNVIYNEEAYVVEGLPETVDITLIGRKADLYFAKQSPSHEVVVDLTGLKPGTHKVNVKYNQALASIDYNVNPSSATVIIYPKISESRTIDVDIINQDKLDSKLVIDSVIPSVSEVIIKGSDDKLADVATVRAFVDINNLVSQEVGDLTVNDISLKAYNSLGQTLDVEIVPEKISASLKISSPSKELPIRIVPKGTVAFGKSIKSLTSSENKVVVYGDATLVGNLTYLPVEVNVDELNNDKEFKIELTKPVGVKSMTVNNLTVSLVLGEATSKDLLGVQINSRNLADGYIVQGITANDTIVDVTLKGDKAVLDSILNNNVEAYVDLNGLKEGEYDLDVLVTGDDLRVEYIAKTKKVKMRITKKN